MADTEPNGRHGEPALRLPPLPTIADHIHETLVLDKDFVTSADQLVRRLFDIGLQLHRVRDTFEPVLSDAPTTRAAGNTLAELIDQLDELIRHTGLTMLARTSRFHPAPDRHGPHLPPHADPP
ncbi:hypothetical protein [Nocardia seriolae]|uniref:Uncharacterized protein n=1 Tax=Nocardia seriolae TaxID=37332 RepID=A0ABC8AU94_9NOCA|nr:hypothetical protein [Nocardia seriolae]APA97765.1 hypothetical protein NS506_03716 [Nocardia seriolae]OJF79795.1 hypothetical protein NS14008_12060 [Nocardia seriolae]PSK27489.1 hypothetical protein C6575_31630 [Nocardia seriolae]QOW36270.1 hypothetical protein IMZ23_16190 [Nocardia seriolae]QUN16223.1 hypothetical protein KEC46_28760 [Nocardia seriolae]